MRPAAAALAILLSAGCLTAVLEAPYVLTTGLGATHGVCPSPHRTLYVATDSGTWEVDGSGQRTRVDPAPSRAVATHATRIYLLDDAGLRWGPLPAEGSEVGALTAVPWTGIRDIQAWCDEQVLVATADALVAWDPPTNRRTPVPGAPAGITALSLGGSGCDMLLAVADSRVWRLSSGTATAITPALEAPRAVAIDSTGTPWVVHGEPPVLARITHGDPQIRARHLGDPRDLQFGIGALFHPLNAYLADGSGTLDYVRVADEAGAEAPTTP